MAVDADTTKEKTEERVVARVYLIRHGETQENRDRIIQGQMDTQLNAHGKWQAQLLGVHKRISNIRIAKMMTSDLSRAVEVRVEEFEYMSPSALWVDGCNRQRLMFWNVIRM
jgi:probable phosphoglycerate mutase